MDINKCGFGFENLSNAKSSEMKWFPINKGGNYRKWYGNHEYLINWENDGYELKNFNSSVLRNFTYSFKESLSWSKVTSGNIAFRYFPYGFLFDSAACSIFLEKDRDMFYLLGFLNSKVCESILSLIAPTLNFNVGNIALLPIIYSEEFLEHVVELVKENIKISEEDWDSFETSWDFKTHTLLKFNTKTIENSYNKCKSYKELLVSRLKSNEIEINKIFIDIYNVNGDVSSDIEDKYLSLNQTNCVNDVKSFISYAVGCMLGRYSLDGEGLIFAGGQWEESKYIKFIPDNDNIIPILDTEYFEDDIVGRFIEFVKVTFGDLYLEENLDFIAKALKNKGNTSREIIRNYFLKDFYKDHLKTYKKHPIYWLFDSGKENGFKALIYMHRYQVDLVARVRTDYLHKTQKALETAINHNTHIIENSTNTLEKAKAIKTRNILVKQLEETHKYDEALAHIANQNISIDLDDGVKVNYAKFQGVEINREGTKPIKIDLLKKI